MKFIRQLGVPIVLCLAALAQHGNAPDGYYPSGFNGDTFTGRVTARDLDSDSVTLEYQKGEKKESITVRLEEGCQVPSKTGEPMHASSIPEGSILKVFYMPKTEKANGEKRKFYIAVDISFIEWQGKAIEEKNRRIFPCGTPSSQKR